MTADMYTKPLAEDLFIRFRNHCMNSVDEGQSVYEVKVLQDVNLNNCTWVPPRIQLVIRAKLVSFALALTVL